MYVLRSLANRVYQHLGRSFVRLKRPRGYLKRQITRQSPLWLEGFRRFLLRFLLIEGHNSQFASAHPSSPHRVSKGRSNRRPPFGRLFRGPKRSTGMALASGNCSRRTWLVTLLAIVLLTTCFGQRFYSQPELTVRSVSPQTFYAPESAEIEDKKATEDLRNNVRNGSLEVLRIDADSTNAAKRSLETLLQQGRELRAQAGSPPFLNLDTLSKPTQDFLFQASETQWQSIWRLAAARELTAEQLAALSSEKGPFPRSWSPKLVSQLQSLGAQQWPALQELLAYRKLSGEQGLTLLRTRIDNRRQQYRKAASELAAAASTEEQPLYNYRLFELSDEQWLLLETQAREIFAQMMLQGIHQGAPEDLLRRAIEARVPDSAGPEVKDLTADVIASAISPNLVLDEARTRQRADKAVNQIEPVMIPVQKGDVIVRANEVIDSTDFALLDHFNFTRRYFNWLGLCSFSLLMAGAVAAYLWIDHRQRHPLNHRDHLLVLVLCLVVSLLAALRVPTIGLPAVGLLVGSFYGTALGITVIALLALVLPIGTPVTTIPLIAGAAAAMVGTWIAPRLRSREEFALLGGFVGLAQGSVHLLLMLIRSPATAPLWKTAFLGSAMHGLYGIAWSVAALGISPYLEHLFDVVTPIRLAELANPNRPLLKRLAAEAPGTFQHTIFVANLAEAAAKALGYNVELVRAGTLYHDIGKMHDPQGFIENQMGGPNKHDEINDPWKSASIIKKHVTQGLVMARKYRLPKAVQAFIPEHQGDMKISYFYQQAKERQAQQPTLVLNEADFRYDGPIPQSPETGITMLADSCEAALRSLSPEASMDEAYAMVNKILRARWRNQQLADSGLSRESLEVIAGVFIQVWQQHHHKRITYPKQALADENIRHSSAS